MNKKAKTAVVVLVIASIIVLSLVFIVIRRTNCGDGACVLVERLMKNCPRDCLGEQPPAPDSEIPYYFFSIHLEPNRILDKVDDGYLATKELVEYANKYNIKLTLKFSAPLAEYVSGSPERMAELEKWKRQGHEIGAHHHDVYKGKGGWDGYSFLPEEEAVATRIDRTGSSEPYLGTLEDYMEKIRRINPDAKSCACNELPSKKSMPDQIVYGIASGYFPYGEPGSRIVTSNADLFDPLFGVNEYIVVGTVNNITRKWLNHAQIFIPVVREGAKGVFDSMEPDVVFGGVSHNAPGDLVSLYNFLDFVHDRDPTGSKSRTMSEIMDREIEPVLPEYELPVLSIDL
jgi:hypothetical protein